MDNKTDNEMNPMTVMLILLLLSSEMIRLVAMVVTGLNTPHVPETTRMATASSIELSDYEKKDAALRGIPEDLYKILTRRMDEAE